MKSEVPNMKRILLCWMLLALLTGCGKAGEPVPEEVPEDCLLYTSPSPRD